MATKSPNETAVRFPMSLAEGTYDAYAERAAKSGHSAEEEMRRTLNRWKDHNDASPVYLNDSQRRELSILSGRLIANADDVLAWAKQLGSLRVASVDVPLSVQLTTRLESRRFGLSWADHIRKLVTESLEQFVGLR